MNLGEKILNYRKKLGFSQEALGDKIGVSRQTVSKWEMNQTIPELDKMILLAKEFGTTIDELVTDEEKRTEEEVAVNESQKKNNKKNIILKILIIIVVLLFVIYFYIVLYRFAILNNIANEIYSKSNAGNNYRIEYYSMKYENHIEKWNPSYKHCTKDGNTKKVYFKNNSDIGEYRVEFLDSKKCLYYDVNLIDKTYVKKSTSDVEFETLMELKGRDNEIAHEISTNLYMYSYYTRLKVACNLEYKIIKEKSFYCVKFCEELGNTIISREYHINSNGLSINTHKVNLENRTEYESELYDLDYGVVINPIMVELPDLTGYVEVTE